mgnify:CR=1 FL=1
MTIKKYYEDEFLSSCTSKITAILQNEPSGIVCESTVAFAEGGGQEGDTGVNSIYLYIKIWRKKINRRRI